jgi:HEPN domain-containing protein
MDIEKVVNYWLKCSNEDWETMEILFNNKRYASSLFFMHLSLEKLLKALIVRNTGEHAPRTHNLSYLAGKTGLEFSERFIDLLAEVTPFNLEMRYPEDIEEFKKKCTEGYTESYIERGKELKEWMLSRIR